MSLLAIARRRRHKLLGAIRGLSRCLVLVVKACRIGLCEAFKSFVSLRRSFLGTKSEARPEEADACCQERREFVAGSSRHECLPICH